MTSLGSQMALSYSTNPLVSYRQSAKRNMVMQICDSSMAECSLEGEVAREAKETMTKGTKERKEIQGSREVGVMGSERTKRE